MSRGGGLGRLQQRSPPTSSNLRREQGGSPLQINWQAGVGGAAQRHRESVQTTPQHLHCSCPSPVPHLSSRCHLSPGKRGCSTERGGGEDGEATEGRFESKLDVRPQRSRVSKRRKMPCTIVICTPWKLDSKFPCLSFSNIFVAYGNKC